MSNSLQYGTSAVLNELVSEILKNIDNTLLIKTVLSQLCYKLLYLVRVILHVCSCILWEKRGTNIRHQMLIFWNKIQTKHSYWTRNLHSKSQIKIKKLGPNYPFHTRSLSHFHNSETRLLSRLSGILHNLNLTNLQILAA